MLIVAHREELRDHITTEARVVLDSVVSESNHQSPPVRSDRCGDLEDDIATEARKILDFVERNGSRRPPIDRSHPLPRQVVLEDAGAGTSRPPVDLPRQVEAEISMKAIEEEYIRLMIELGRADRERKKKNN